jgi:hypothetical protein
MESPRFKSFEEQEDEEEDELTDDEAYFKRHSSLEQEEVRRYNLGVNVNPVIGKKLSKKANL